MRNFEQFIAVDWSGAKAPKSGKSIAVAQAHKQTKSVTMPPPPDGGNWSRQDVADLIGEVVRRQERTLIGVDCNFGYAAEVGRQQLGPSYSYQDLWRAVEQTSADQADFYAEGFWTDDRYKKAFWISGEQNGFVLPRRKTEEACGTQGYGFPESPFKMIGPKQVGKGGLAGMRMAHYLKSRYGDRVCVWPFEHMDADKAWVVITEIYPRLFLSMAGHGIKKVTQRDELERVLKFFETTAPDIESFSDHDSDALISTAGLRHLCGNGLEIPEHLSGPCGMTGDAARCEGWIFGVR